MTVSTSLSTLPHHFSRDSIWHRDMAQEMLALVTLSKALMEHISFNLYYAFVHTSLAFVLL